MENTKSPNNSNAVAQEKTSIEKLKKITGRKESLNKISCFISAKTPEQARSNVKMLKKNEKLFQIFGTRPNASIPSSHLVSQSPCVMVAK
ncbi:hypothetical protein CYY_005869 [Polysphondylium violaceum]|uniref:Uncharacterized protein n=1 Tax=Polysphondylium violaceum TaxID=133409 RepID=A0A8J4URW3_9MYCE|nr:hypothetical protein CYY_005869 [Polysphondylium violaceum]